MFIQRKKVKDIGYYYLVESQRKEGLPKKKMEIYLGTRKDVDDLFKDYKKKRK